MARWRMGWFLGCVALLIGASPALAGGKVGVYTGAARAVTNTDLLPRLPSSDHGAVKYTVQADFKGGLNLYWSARLFNFGMGDGKCEVTSMVRRRGKDAVRGGSALGSDEYSIQSSPFLADFRGHVLSGTRKELTVKGNGKGYSFELTFKPALRAWRPGSGKVTFPDGTFFESLLVMPKARVEGMLTIDGKTTYIQGTGYVSKSRGNAAPYLQAKRFVEFRKVQGNTVIWMKEFVTSDEFGAVRVPYLLVARKGKILVSTTDFEADYLKMTTDTKSGKNYKVPQAFVLRAKGVKGESVTLGIQATRLVYRRDKLKRMNAMKRVIVSRYMHPIQFAHKAKFEMQVVPMEGEAWSVSGTGATYEVNHLNP